MDRQDRQDGNWEGGESFQDAYLLRGGKDLAEGGFSLSACGDPQAGNPLYRENGGQECPPSVILLERSSILLPSCPALCRAKPLGEAW